MDASWARTNRLALMTADPELQDQLLRLCAAASVTPDVVDETTGARQVWARAGAVLVGDDQAPALARLGLNRRDQVVVVSLRREPAPLWQLAVQLHADDVVLLPGDEARLVERLSDLVEGAGRALTVAVIGGCGGAGASTMAGALALTAARSGRECLLVDIDPLGGGIDLLVGCEESGGLRWPDLAATEGRVSAAAFRAALPSSGALPVLSWDRGAPRRTPPVVVRAMMGAARRGSDLVVVDLPRHLDEAATEGLLLSDVLAVVVTTEVRGVASARSMLDELGEVCADIRVVVREIPGSDVSPKAVADSLALPLAGTVATQRGVARAVNAGVGPLGRGGLARSCQAILDVLSSERTAP